MTTHPVKIVSGHSRRAFLAYFSVTGLAATAFPETLVARAEEKGVLDKEVLASAEKAAGLEFTDKERDLMLEGVEGFLKSYEAIRALKIGNEVPPALYFDPVPAGSKAAVDGLPAGGEAALDAAALKPAAKMEPAAEGAVGAVKPAAKNEPAPEKGPVKKPEGKEDLAFLPLARLAELVRTGQVTSMELTRLYLERLKAYDGMLKCVVNLTEERALAAAASADGEIAKGGYRGPLHGIPWGAKDLFAVKGYPTTWGAAPFRDQVIDEDASVVRRLDEAGAVLAAKLTLGALAMGDVWFEDRTRNPWKVSQGSSGSSAGPASAAAAGLAGFTVGTETRGSILSPCNICGATGLRPTFGRVSRHGAMALSWSMDKIGPICRTAEDCALVFEAIQGPDGKDPTVKDLPFAWRDRIDPKDVRVGYLKSIFDEKPRKSMEEWHNFDLAVLETLRSLGFDLIPVELPDFPVEALSFLLSCEAAAAFDDLTLSNRDDELKRQDEWAWPNTFRKARMVPAVEYIQGNRARQMLMRQTERAMEQVDLWVCPTYGGDNLALTNLTGHPAVVLPNGFRERDGTPTSITFNGRLFGESKLLAVAWAYQQATGFHLRRPDLEGQRGG